MSQISNHAFWNIILSKMFSFETYPNKRFASRMYIPQILKPQCDAVKSICHGFCEQCFQHFVVSVSSRDAIVLKAKGGQTWHSLGSVHVYYNPLLQWMENNNSKRHWRKKAWKQERQRQKKSIKNTCKWAPAIYPTLGLSNYWLCSRCRLWIAIKDEPCAQTLKDACTKLCMHPASWRHLFNADLLISMATFTAVGDGDIMKIDFHKKRTKNRAGKVVSWSVTVV